MTDNLCESCDHWCVHWDMHCECRAGVIKPDTYRSVRLGCPKYKNEEKEDDENV